MRDSQVRNGGAVVVEVTYITGLSDCRIVFADIVLVDGVVGRTREGRCFHVADHQGYAVGHSLTSVAVHHADSYVIGGVA